MTRPHHVRAAAACLATGALSAIALLAAGGPAAHPASARAAVEHARPGAGDVAIARRRLNVVAGRRALVSGRVAGAAAGSAVALQRRGGAGWRTIDPDRTPARGALALRLPPRPPGSAVVPVRRAPDRPRPPRRRRRLRLPLPPAPAGQRRRPRARGGHQPARRPAERLPPRARLLVRAGPVRRAPRLRRDADAAHARRREQDAA